MMYYKWYGLFEKDGETKTATLKLRVRYKRNAETVVKEKVNEMKREGYDLSMDSGLIRCNRNWYPI